MAKILIGHPDKRFRYELRRFLESHKYGIIEADNGGALFTITKLQQPDFVIMADGMASLSTEDYLKKIKEFNLEKLVVIVLTTREYITRSLLLLELGAREVLLEPIKEDEILFHLKRLSFPLPEYINNLYFQKEYKYEKLDKPSRKTESQRQPISTRLQKVASDIKEESSLRAENSSLLLRQAYCQFCNKEEIVKLYTLKTRTIVIEPNLFDVDCYIGAIGASEYCDYSLLEVCVCQNCLFATNDFRLFDIQSLKAEETSFLSEFMHTSFMKKLDERKQLASKCSNQMFSEHRSVSDALIAIDLAVHFLNFLYENDKLKYSMTQNEIFQLLLKAAAIAEKAQIFDVRNRKYIEAYQFGLNQMALKGEIGILRHAVQMYALSYLLKQQDNLQKYGKELFVFLSKKNVNPQVRIKSREYADRAKKYFGWVEDEKHWV